MYTVFLGMKTSTEWIGGCSEVDYHLCVAEQGILRLVGPQSEPCSILAIQSLATLPTSTSEGIALTKLSVPEIG